MSQNAKPQVSPEALSGILSKAVLDAMNGAESRIQQAATKAAEKAVNNTGELLTGLIDAVEERLSGIKPAVLEVQVNNGDIKRLTKTPSPLLPDLLTLAALKMPVLIKGPAGSGKTTVALQVAEVLGLPFYTISLSSDMGVTALFGRQTANGFTESPIVKAIRDGGVLLIDEMDAGNEQVLIALNPLRGGHGGNGTVLNPVTGESIKIHENFVFIAACNTWGKGADHVYTSRNRLDAAYLDGFCLKELDYSDEIEAQIAASYSADKKLLKRLQTARKELKKLGADEIISTRGIERIHVLATVGAWEESKAIRAVTASWPEGLAKQVGLE